MSIEEIKKFLIENKKYIFIVAAILVGLIFINSRNHAEVSNNNDFKTVSLAKSENKKANEETNNKENSSGKVTCDIYGAINHQGVYTLQNGARMQDLIDAAGGLTSRAQIKAINRAAVLKDQDKVYIPYKGEKVATINTVNSEQNDTATGSSQGEKKNDAKINLNSASAADLQKLNGIGEKRAEQIINYREQNGDFKKIDDLMQVSGIGEKTFAALKDQLTV